MNELRFTPLQVWAKIAKVNIGIARAWAQGDLLEEARETGDTWIIPLSTEVPSKSILLGRAEELYREKRASALLDFEQDPANRARWSKEQIMTLCQWPYDWRTLRRRLEEKVGLIMLRPGILWKKGMKLWTFATCPEDREWGIANAARMQLGAMKRTAKVTSLSIAPPSEMHALNDRSKDRIDAHLKKQDAKFEDIMRTLQNVKQDLLDRDTMKLLAEFSEYEEDEEYDNG